MKSEPASRRDGETATGAAVQASGQWALLPTGSIEVVKDFNPRRAFSEAGLGELAESIKANGIIEPLIVRPAGLEAHNLMRRGERNYLLVAGERRLRAAKLAGLKEIPCLVRELTPEEALRLAVLENLQREDVSSLEEAEGFQRLIASKQFTADTLAAKLGKSREHIYGRLRLLKLDKRVLAALDAGQIEASTAGLLAKFHPGLQGEILKRLSTHDCLSFRDAKAELERELRPLATATFLTWAKGQPAESAAFLTARKPAETSQACAGCPHNSANMPDLAGQKKPVCLNATCYELKTETHGRWQLAEAAKAGRPIVELDRRQWDWNGAKTNYTSTWQAVDEEAHDLPWDEKRNKYLTWREWLKGIDHPASLALSPAGVVVELVKPREVRAKLIEMGKLKPKETAGKAATTEERRAVIVRNKKRRAETARLGAACLAKARQFEELDFWRWAWFAVEKDWRMNQTLGESLGVKKTNVTDATLTAALLALPTPDRQEKLLKAFLSPRGEWEEYRVNEIAEELKVK